MTYFLLYLNQRRRWKLSKVHRHKKVFIYVYLQFKSEFKENYLALTSLQTPLYFLCKIKHFHIILERLPVQQFTCRQWGRYLGNILPYYPIPLCRVNIDSLGVIHIRPPAHMKWLRYTLKMWNSAGLFLLALMSITYRGETTGKFIVSLFRTKWLFIAVR